MIVSEETAKRSADALERLADALAPNTPPYITPQTWKTTDSCPPDLPAITERCVVSKGY